jgi:hypothetical protein
MYVLLIRKEWGTMTTTAAAFRPFIYITYINDIAKKIKHRYCFIMESLAKLETGIKWKKSRTMVLFYKSWKQKAAILQSMLRCCLAVQDCWGSSWTFPICSLQVKNTIPFLENSPHHTNIHQERQLEVVWYIALLDRGI